MTTRRRSPRSWLRAARSAGFSWLVAIVASCTAVTPSGPRAAPARPPTAPLQAPRTPQDRLQPYVDALKQRIDARAASALNRIDGVARELLAARSYLRAGPDLGQRWSWDDTQIESFAGSAEQQALLREIGVVRATFEGLYPGFTLSVNERIRSLDQQIEQWNQNESVAAAATNLEKWIDAYLGASGWPAANDDATAHLLADALIAYIPQPLPPLAAPGLSAHGQARAIDFRVYRGDTEIAGAEIAQIATVWDGPDNWSGRLAYAVRRSNAKFKGPLITPREPWHYEFVP